MQAQVPTTRYSKPNIASGLFPVVFAAGPQVISSAIATTPASLTTNWTQCTHSSGLVGLTLAATYDGVRKIITAGVSTGTAAILAAGSAPLYNNVGVLIATSINIATLSEVEVTSYGGKWYVTKTSLAGITYT